MKIDPINEQSIIREEVAKHLFSNGVGALLTSSLVSMLLTYMLWNNNPPELLIGWLVLINAVYLVRLAVGRSYARAEHKDGNLWLNRFRIGTLISAVVWGLGVILLFPSNNVVGQSAISFTVLGMSAGSVMAYAVDFVSLLCYVIPVVVPLIVRLMMEGTPQSLAMSIMLILSIGFIGITLRRSNKTLHDNIRLRINSVNRETDIREKNKFLNSILDNEPECVKVISLNGKLLQMNRAGLAILEMDSLAQAQQIEMMTFVQPAYLDAFIKLHKSACLGNSGKLEIQIRGHQGTLRMLETHAAPLYDDDGRVRSLLYVSRDVTELKKSDALLRESRNRYHRLVENAPFGIMVHQNGKFVYVNPAAIKLLGATDKNELLGKLVMDFIHPDFHQIVQTRIAKGLGLGLGEIAPLLEEKFVRLDGTIINVEVQGTIIEYEGKPAVQASVYDVTERKQTLQREQHRQKVLQMLADKSSLDAILNTIVHDVESINPAMLCSILLLNEEGTHLKHGAAPSLPDFYNQAVDGVQIGPNTGTCGTAAYTGQRVIVEDIETHPYWTPYLELAHRAKLAACWSEPILSGQGKVLGTFAIYHRLPAKPTDFDLKLIENEALLAALAIEKTTDEVNLQLAASVFTHAREGIMITNAAGDIIEINDTFTQITGYTREEAIGENPRLLKSDMHDAETYAAMWQSLTEVGYWSGEIWNQRKNGENYVEIQTVSAVRDSSGKIQNYVALFTDITPIKEQQLQLEHIAYHDALTSLPNRVLLSDRLQQAMIQSQRRGMALAVAYLDLDGFKAVNDKYGHDVGDEMLIALSQRMKTALREGDTLSRIGGDEFVAVLVDLESAQDCEPVLARLLQAAADPVTVGGILMQISVSIGVTLYPQDEADADQLMRHADQAMYTAKQEGKNRYHIFDVAHDAQIQSQRESLEHIRQALDNREFVLYYQPKVNMKTGVVIGAEALIRWQHPEHGLLPPAAFLPIIENHPISIEIGEWVIDTALAQIKKWRNSGLTIPVSVNVGARQLQQDDFVARLSGLLAAHPDIKPSQLELEILETSALEDVIQISTVMHRCHDIGVSFALDDFGTGYSSLTYLKRLPADVLKIDQSFVRDMLNDSEDMAIIEGIVGLAKIFYRQVIAEGVETIPHGKALLRLGCERAQGYGIARPMPAADIPKWIKTWQPDASWLESNGRSSPAAF